MNDIIARALAKRVENDITSKFYTDFSNKPNGSVVLDVNKPYSIHNTASVSTGYVLSNGYLVHGNPSGNNAASYLDVELDSKITRIGATISFPAGNSGVIALCVFDKSIASELNLGNAVPNAGIHYVISKTGIEMGLIESGVGGIVQKRYDFPSTLADDTDYDFEIVREGTKKYAKTPFGTITLGVDDSRVNTWVSKYATFEIFENDNTYVPAKIKKIWADDRIKQNTKNIMDLLDLAKSKDQTYDLNKRWYAASSTTGDTNFTGSYQDLFTLNITVPESKQVIVDASVYARIVTAGILILRVTSDAIQANSTSLAVSEVTGQGKYQITGKVILTGNVGSTATIKLQGFMASGSGYMNLNDGQGKRCTIAVHPI